MNTCISCKFWSPQPRRLDPHGRASEKSGLAVGVGDCHNQPPIPTQGSSGMFRSFPATLESDWCGQYQSGKVEPQIAKDTKPLTKV